MPEYTYYVEGRDASGETWSASGRIATTENTGAFDAAVMEALRESFLKVTQGKAVYGHPGTTCRGPYQIVTLTVVKHDTDAEMAQLHGFTRHV